MITLKEVDKKNNALTPFKKLCRNCGHSVIIIELDRIICTHCGKWIYKDDKTEFMYKMREEIKKNGSKKNV